MTIFNFIHFHIFYFLFFICCYFTPKRMSSWLFILTVNILLRFSRKNIIFHLQVDIITPTVTSKKKKWMNGRKNKRQTKHMEKWEPSTDDYKDITCKITSKNKTHHILLYTYRFFSLLRLSRNTFSYEKKKKNFFKFKCSRSLGIL